MRLNKFTVRGENCVDVFFNTPIDVWLSNHSVDEMIPVDSAFMMLAIYKLPQTFDCLYDWQGLRKEPDCEHVAFHRCLLEHGAKIRIMPVSFCGPWPEFSQEFSWE